MTTCINYLSCGHLAKGQCIPLRVGLCVDETKVLETYRYEGRGFIDAVIVQVLPYARVKGVIQYTICFDESVLVPGANIKECDIEGIFVKGCLTDYIESRKDSGLQGRSLGESVYGAGGDGDAVIQNGQELWYAWPARNMYYDNLTIEDGGILHTYGQIATLVATPALPTVKPPDNTRCVYAQVFAQNLIINGILSCDGPDAVGSSGATKGATFSYGGDGDSGGAGGFGIDATHGAATQGSYPAGNLGTKYPGGMCGDFGGDGGKGGGANGAAARVINHADAQYGHTWKINHLVPHLVTFSISGGHIADALGGGSGGCGGSGGGRTGSSAYGGRGGGGGAGGGPLYIAARNIIIGTTGKIYARGGAGAAGLPATLLNGSSGHGGGGGGGGGGGFVYMLYESLCNLGIIDVSGGAAGVGGAGAGAEGVAGDPGTAGSVGNIVKYNLRTNKFES